MSKDTTRGVHDEHVRCRRTLHGFRFGAMKAEACMSLPGGRSVITITSDNGQRLDIYCSKTGRSLRVFAHDANRNSLGELKPLPISDARS